MPHLPALITSGDVMPGGGDLNGRRWAGHQLLRAWARFAQGLLTLLMGPPPYCLQPWLEESALGNLPLGLVTSTFRDCGVVLLDPSIGRWAQWRQPWRQCVFIDGQITPFPLQPLGFIELLMIWFSLGRFDLQQHCGPRCVKGC